MGRRRHLDATGPYNPACWLLVAVGALAFVLQRPWRRRDGAGVPRAASSLALNPNGEIPVQEEPDRGLVVWESGAIVFHIAERLAVPLPAEGAERTAVLRWAPWQAAHLGPTLGRDWTFAVFTGETLPPVTRRFEREARRLFGVLDRQLARQAHVTGGA